MEITASRAEHHSVLLPFQELSYRTGATFKWTDLTEDGRVRTDNLDEVCTAPPTPPPWPPSWLAKAGTRPDPFGIDVVVTPHPHPRRWLTNELAQRLGRPGEGICARLVRHPGPAAARPGRPGAALQPRQLAWCTSAGERRLHPRKRGSINRAGTWPGQHPVRGATAQARPLHRYLHWRPELVAGWLAADTDEHGADLSDAWQPVLWRYADADLLAATAGSCNDCVTNPPPCHCHRSCRSCNPTPLSPWWLDLLEAIAAHRQVHVSLVDDLTHGPLLWGRRPADCVRAASTVRPVGPSHRRAGDVVQTTGHDHPELVAAGAGRRGAPVRSPARRLGAGARWAWFGAPG